MIPTVKISQTILEFGVELINELPDDHNKMELEAATLLISTVWNAVKIDSDNKNKEHEKTLLQTLKNEQRDVQVIVKQLIKRKKVNLIMTLE
ncbi:MAG: hypothetical protein ACI9D5_002447 [Candidatus Endobugula sp.]|jgi:hypothetical protein